MHRDAAVSLHCIADKKKKKKQGQQDKLQIRYATRLAPIKNAANFNQFVVGFFSFLFFSAITCGNLSCHAGCVYGENSFVKPCAAEWLQAEDGEGVRQDNSRNLAGNLEHIVRARKATPSWSILEGSVWPLGSVGVKSFNSASVQQTIDWAADGSESCVRRGGRP